MCSPHNRRGFMCGECIDGYDPAVSSPTTICVKCTSGFSRYATAILYLLAQLIPRTLLFVLLIFFRLNITSGPLIGYIWFCQLSNTWTIEFSLYSVLYNLLSVSRYLRLLMTLSQTLFSFWALSFSKPVIPPFCVSEKLTTIHIHLFELLVATYPFVLVITACILIEMHKRNFILCKPIECLLKKTNYRFAVTTDAVFRAFASLFLLSNIRVMTAFLELISTTYVRNSTEVVQKRVFIIDPTVEYFGTKHIMCILIALLPYLLTSLLPSLLLLI